MDAATLTIVFAGGGSGGHLFPALAVDAAIRETCPAAWIKYFCSDRKIDASILNAADADYEALPSESSARWRTPWRIILRNWSGYRLAKSRLRELQADCVIGCGGFASVPTVLAARSLGIPIVLLEQNVLPGRATRWLSRYADAIYTSFPETTDLLNEHGHKVDVTGNPLRPSMVSLRAASVTQELEQQQLLILGGSLGSQTLNALVAPVLIQHKAMLTDWKVVHQAGENDVESLSREYAAAGIDARVVPFLDAIEAEYVRSSLVVCRAGATTLWELACLGLPCVLVPFAGAKDDHQTHNARWFANQGAAELIASNDTPLSQLLSNSLQQLLTSPEKRLEMASAMHALGRPDAARDIARLLLEKLLQDQVERPRPRK